MNGASRIQVGLDLVRISHLTASVDRFGGRFLDRVFTEGELRYCMAAPGPSASRLAARFAAKEATRKVLRVDDEGVGWRSIEVVRASNGACDLLLHREARELAERAGFVAFSLSMTHEAEYAGAVVVGERRRGEDAR